VIHARMRHLKNKRKMSMKELINRAWLEKKKKKIIKEVISRNINKRKN